MITQKYLKECFEYDPDSGDLIWKERPLEHFKSKHAQAVSNKKTKGNIVKSKHPNGRGKNYLKVGFSTLQGKKSLLVHRIIWMIVYGEWPEFIDHINGNGTDNRLSNLRSVSMEENNRNIRKLKTNTTGSTGVYENKISNKWVAMIWNGNKQINLGTYKTKAEALAARKGAEKALGYHPNHGKEKSR